MDKNDVINGLVFRSLHGPEMVLASPDTIRDAIEKGLPITEQQKLPVEEAINKLFDHRKQHAQRLASNILPCPIPETPILYLYDQISQCILFDMNGAAITFCGILVEYALKYTTYMKENPGTADFDSAAWNEFEEITLVPAIVRAKKAGLIDDEIEKRLRSFAKDLRNRYSHFNIQKITEGAVFGKVKAKNIKTGEETEVELSASKSPTLQIIAKEKMDELNVLKVFEFADRVVQHLFVTLTSKK
ncbi:MAG: hypothetical protein WC880_05210 [Candidatus Paceibacterota bacterium]